MSPPVRIVAYALVLGTAGYLFFRALSREAAVDRAASPDADVPRIAHASPPSNWRPAAPAAADDPLLEISGVVREADTDEPIPAALVVLEAVAGESRATTGSDGRYRLRVQPGRYRSQVTAEHYFAAADLPAIEIGPPGPAGPAGPAGPPGSAGQDTRHVARVDFVLHRAARVSGRVVDGHARDLRGAAVSLHQALGSHRFDVRAETASDAGGRFSLEVPPGEVVLRAVKDGFGDVLSRPVYLRSGADVTGIELMLGGGLSLAGQVIGPDRQRVGDARVSLSDELGVRTIASDAEGAFSFGGLQPGRKLLQAMASGFSPSRVSGVLLRDGPGNKVIVTLTERKLLGGQVVDAQGQPVASAAVEVLPGMPGRHAGVSHLLEPLSATSDSLGRFSFAGVPDLPLRVTATGPGNTRASRAGVLPGVRNLVLRLQGTGGIVGRVSDGRTGRGIDRFTVVAGVGGVPPASVRVLAPDGRYHLRDMVAGRYRLSFTAEGYGPTVLPQIDVVAGSDVAAYAVLNAGGRVSGVVVDSRGVPIPGTEVRMDSGWAATTPAVTGSSGTFLLEDVARGRRSLTVTHPSYDTRIVSGVSVFPGESAVVRVELSPHAGKPAMRLTGIGVVLARSEGGPTVVRVLPGSPGLVAGLRTGDRFERIDGRPTASLSFSDAVESIRGLAGTSVRLTVRRDEQTFERDILRQEVSVSGSS